jgi:ATP adenylyltransferase
MTLWNATLEQKQRALAAGLLDPIETHTETIADQGVHFIVRRVSSLARKTAQRARASAYAPDHDPERRVFPLERELLVEEVGATHFAVLNKFPVIPHHLLLITRGYVPQEALLDRADFEALSVGIRDFDGLGFYNGGTPAGASQPHKHLQVVPLPLGATDAVPMAALFDPGTIVARTVPGLPFRHAFAWTGELETPARLLEIYHELLGIAGIGIVELSGVLHQAAPYNLLVTERWMLVVARSREDFDGISINALGYAGSIFVRNLDELARVRQAGPMKMLQAVALPSPRQAPEGSLAVG